MGRSRPLRSAAGLMAVLVAVLTSGPWQAAAGQPATTVPPSPSLPSGVPVDANRAAPLLRVEGDDFPDLIMHLPRFEADGTQLPLACDQVRARRLDELDPRWRRAVGRIHLDCESVEAGEEALPTVATVITAYLAPGKVELARLPVAEVRLMDSDLWSDHQYVLAAPYLLAGPRLRDHVERRCRLAQDNPGLIGRRDCRVTEEAEGLYIETGAIGGIWIHPDPHDAQRSVYAESWAD